MLEEAKKKMEEGWKARENLEFDKAEKLLLEAKEIFEKNEDWFNVTETLNHLSYNEKLKAVHSNLRGMKFAKNAEELAGKYTVKKGSILRALISLSSSAGLYEQALKYAKDALDQTVKPMSKADLLSHAAVFYLRTGNINSALDSINEAEELMKNHFEEEGEPQRSIWKSKVLATKGLILYNLNDLENAKQYMTEAYKLALKQNLKTRMAEISAQLELFN